MVLLVVVGCALFLLVGYLTYGKYLAKKVFELDDNNPVPSQEINDGVDYVPAKKGMLMGQHFSAIAAAGPVNGPILAAVMFGWVAPLIELCILCIVIQLVTDALTLLSRL